MGFRRRHWPAVGAVLELLFAVLANPQMTVHAEINDRSREAALVESQIIDVAHGGSRHAPRRSEQWNNGALRWIAADLGPRIIVVTEQQNDAGDGDRHRSIVR